MPQYILYIVTNTYIHRSLKSVTNWFQNERHPLERLGETRKKPWFIVKPMTGDKARPAQGPQPLDRYACQTTVKTLVEVEGDPFSWEGHPSATEIKAIISGKSKRGPKPRSGAKSHVISASKVKTSVAEKSHSFPHRRRTGSVSTAASTTPEFSSGDSNASMTSSPRHSPNTQSPSSGSLGVSVPTIDEQQAAYAMLALLQTRSPAPAIISHSAHLTPWVDAAFSGRDPTAVQRTPLHLVNTMDRLGCSQDSIPPSHTARDGEFATPHVGMYATALPSQDRRLAFIPYVKPTRTRFSWSTVRTVMIDDEVTNEEDTLSAPPCTRDHGLTI